MHACVYVCMHMCTCVRIYVCMHVCVVVCMCVCMCACMYTCMCVRVCVYVSTILGVATKSIHKVTNPGTGQQGILRGRSTRYPGTWLRASIYKFLTNQQEWRSPTMTLNSAYGTIPRSLGYPSQVQG